MTPGARVLVVDDEPRYVKLLRFNLEAAGHEVVDAGSAEEAFDVLATQTLDLVILDIMLPGVDGFEACQKIRDVSDVAIIMLTARNTAEDRLRGFRAGADDYVSKPFSAQELMARVEAVLRRTRTGGAPGGQPSFSSGDLHVDFLTHRVTVGGRPVRLSPTEYRLLRCLALNAGRVMTQDDLLVQVWGVDYEGDVLRVTIRRLRQKLEPSAEIPRRIANVPGIGYMLVSGD